MRWSEPLLERVLMQMEPLLSSGLTLIDTLSIVEKSLPKKIAHAFSTVREKVLDGERVPEAFQAIGWPPYAVYSLAMADRTGDYGEQFRQLKDYYRKRIRFRKEMWGKLTYPLILISFALVLLIFMLVYFIPYLTELNASIVSLQPQTERENSAGEADPFLLPKVMIVVVATLIVVCAVLAFLARKPRAGVLRFLLVVPFLGPFIRRTYTREVVSQLAVSLEAGYDILSAATMLGKEAWQPVIQGFYRQLADAVSAGATVAEATVGIFWLDQDWHMFIVSGERSGRLTEQLNVYGDRLQFLTEQQLSAVLAWVEPGILVFIGGIVFMLVMSVFSPLMDMIHTLS
ncbi:MAG: type II secretion system F family protein [Candidatus Carbobacillus altaicus]|nr:type II secretion system F family protein [Candidatus Carbobacillus altaicus]